MMSLLVPYIFHRFRQHGFTNRECSITALPGKMTISVVNRLYPSATVSFHLFHKMGDGFVPRKLTKHVNVVRNTTYKHCLATGGIDELSDVTVNTFQMLLLDRRAGSLDMEDDVEVYFT